jgi:arabinofuranosyltransferase
MARQLRPDSKATVLLIAATVTAAASALSYLGLSGVPGHGIDDANITQVYARNIANGFGYVYRPGGEPVEGSTSAAWTVINASIFATSGNPFLALHLLCLFVSLLIVAVTLALALDLAKILEIPIHMTVLITSFIILANPAYFAWTVWSLMDITIWSLVVVVLLWLCLRHAGDQAAGLAALLAYGLAAVAAVVIRPEGIAYALGVTLAAAVARDAAFRDARGAGRLLLAGAGAPIIACAAITAFRLRYFGYPLPNTYYAKVSADLLSTLRAGAEYLVLALCRLNFMALSLAAWLAIALALLLSPAPRAARVGKLAGVSAILAGLCSFLLIVCLTGGDHFNGQRFLQPIWPVAAVGLALAIAAVVDVPCRLARPVVRRSSMLLVGFVVVATQNALFAQESWYDSSTRSIYMEFRIAEAGRQLGSRLEALAARHGGFSVGVTAAGGIAFTFRGPIYDLLGLNWVEMAHAQKNKVGIRNHASFDAEVFFRALPDVMPMGHRVDAFTSTLTKGIILTERFRLLYAPVVLQDEMGELYLFIARRWLAANDTTGVRTVAWSEVSVSNPCRIGHFGFLTCD